MRWTKFGLACVCGGAALAATLSANAASNLSNSLAGFTGDSNQAGTQAAVSSAGLNFYSTAGPLFGNNDNGTPDDPSDDFIEQQSDDTVTFDSSGAHFGALFAGDGGRNYMRTNDSDYATTSFVAEVTFENDDNKAVFIGLGAGDRALFGTPDWSTQFSSASFWPEPQNDKFTRFRTQNDMNNFGDTTVPGFDAGTHRFRMTFNANNGQLLGEIDLNYAGGPFVADAVSSNFPIVTTSLYAADGWPSEPSRIFFGGDDGAVFRDLVIRVVPEPVSVVMLLGGAAIAAACGRRRV
ncbi:MAG: hypothetical protein AB7G28_08260 [Pirellulales bacterium]